ncbi:MAG: DNA-directed RNA polymerase subunit omega [Marinilabiliaceae bacterium]
MPVDFKKSNAPLNTITRDTVIMSEKTGNVYEMVNIIAKRANQISIDIKEELSKKLQEFASYTDGLEEVFENREQIEISRFYERLPKPVSIATQEYCDDKLFYRRPDDIAKQKDDLDAEVDSNAPAAK